MPTPFVPCGNRRPRALILAIALGTAALAGCQGGTPWGATPQQAPLPQLDNIAAQLNDVAVQFEADTTAGAQRVADRVRAALAAEPRLSGAQLGVDGFEGGVIVLSGTVPSAAEQELALQTARGIAGVRQVVDRMHTP